MNYIVIPAYQPDNKLIKLIEKIHEKSDFHILVIDDGRFIESVKISLIKQNKYATVLRHEVNQGKGQALKTAFSYIQEQKHLWNCRNSRCGWATQKFGIFSVRLTKLLKILTS